MMKNRWISLIMVLTLFLAFLPSTVSAEELATEQLMCTKPEIKPNTQTRTENFLKNYTLTGNGAKDMVAIALAQEGCTGSQFGYTDVSATDWYANAVLWAVQEGITYGLSETQSGPNEVCNRSQVVTFLYRAYN